MPCCCETDPSSSFQFPLYGAMRNPLMIHLVFVEAATSIDTNGGPITPFGGHLIVFAEKNMTHRRYHNIPPPIRAGKLCADFFRFNFCIKSAQPFNNSGSSSRTPDFTRLLGISWHFTLTHSSRTSTRGVHLFQPRRFQFSLYLALSFYHTCAGCDGYVRGVSCFVVVLVFSRLNAATEQRVVCMCV